MFTDNADILYENYLSQFIYGNGYYTYVSMSKYDNNGYYIHANAPGFKRKTELYRACDALIYHKNKYICAAPLKAFGLYAMCGLRYTVSIDDTVSELDALFDVYAIHHELSLTRKNELLFIGYTVFEDIKGHNFTTNETQIHLYLEKLA